MTGASANCPYCRQPMKLGKRDGVDYADCKECHITIYYWKGQITTLTENTRSDRDRLLMESMDLDRLITSVRAERDQLRDTLAQIGTHHLATLGELRADLATEKASNERHEEQIVSLREHVEHLRASYETEKAAREKAEAALQWVADSGKLTRGLPVLPIDANELRQFAAAFVAAHSKKAKG